MPRSGRWTNRRKDERRKGAEVRQAERAKLTPQQQIDKLKRAGFYYSTRPGGGLTKEASRLEGKSGAARVS